MGFGTTALLGFVLPLAPASPADAADAVRPIVDAEGEWSGRTRAEALQALVELGPELVPGACAYLFEPPGDERDEEDEAEEGLADEAPDAASWEPEALLFEALETARPESVVAGVLARVDPESSIEARLTATRMLGDFGDGDAFGPLFRLYAHDPPVVVSRPSVAGRLGAALARMLERDPSSWSALEQQTALRPELERVRLERFAERGDDLALDTLIGALGRAPELDAYVLGALGRLSPRVVHHARDELCDLAERQTHGITVEVQRAALGLLGDLVAVESMDALLEALEFADERVRASARRALVAMSGVDRREDPGAWKLFWEVERTWRTERFDLAVLELETGDLAVARRATTELLSHPLFRRDAAAALARVAGSAEPERARMAVGTLAALSDAAVVGHLIGLVDRGDEIGATAARALEAATGERFEAPEDWVAWWRG